MTRYAPDEKFPGGEFPNQNPRAGEGLATWVIQNRSLEESDVVLWYASSFFFFSHNKTTSSYQIFCDFNVDCSFHRYVFGIIHVPRLEDWPVMPVEHIGFTLMVSQNLSVTFNQKIS